MPIIVRIPEPDRSINVHYTLTFMDKNKMNPLYKELNHIYKGSFCESITLE